MGELDILNQGQRLKKIRKKLKVRQDELAGKKFSKNYISMFENNKRRMNPVNATYLAKRINTIATENELDIFVTASDLLKSQEDVAKDKCDRWLEDVEINSNLKVEDILKNLNNAMIVADKYNLIGYYGRAVYLKGIHCLNRQLYKCAVTHFLHALEYFLKLDNKMSLLQTYKYIGICLYRQRDIKQSIIFLNLAAATINSECNVNEDNIEEIRYYRALCYFELGEYDIAQNIIGKMNEKSIKLLELANEINKKLAKYV